MWWYEASVEVKGIPVTRYVASYYVGGGKQNYDMASKWLSTLTIDNQKLTEDEIRLVADCIVNGKFELQESIKEFAASYKYMECDL